MKNIEKMSDRELRVELRETRGLLAAAKCPNECEGGVMLVQGLEGFDTEQCQWCADRSRLLAEGL